MCLLVLAPAPNDDSDVPSDLLSGKDSTEEALESRVEAASPLEAAARRPRKNRRLLLATRSLCREFLPLPRSSRASPPKVLATISREPEMSWQLRVPTWRGKDRHRE